MGGGLVLSAGRRPPPGGLAGRPTGSARADSERRGPTRTTRHPAAPLPRVALLIAAAAYGGWRELRAAFPRGVPALALPAATASGVWQTAGSGGTRSELVVNLAEAVRAGRAQSGSPDASPHGWDVGALTVK